MIVLKYNVYFKTVFSQKHSPALALKNLQFSVQGNLYKKILTREILHQSMWNWALNFLSQLMTGSISWLQRSWLCGLSTSRRHDEKGTSAPTITYTLERGGDSEIQSVREEKTRDEKTLD